MTTAGPTGGPKAIANTLYRRPLPEDLVAFSSPEGRRVFREALAEGTLEGWFAVAEQFHTQADPAFCGLGSLVVALNALGVDPQRLWKGPWRWFSEELLDCCVSLDVVRARGITLVELACLARCNGALAEVRRADEYGVEALRASIEAASKETGTVIVAAYGRAALGQSGSGHYSPIGGFHRARDLTLLLDVARFKYPPHWVSVERLHHAMTGVDPDTGRSRGWVELRRKPDAGGLLASIVCGASAWSTVVDAFARPRERFRAAASATAAEALAVFADEVASIVSYLTWRDPIDRTHGKLVERLRTLLSDSPAGRALAGLAGDRVELATAFFYTLSPQDFSDLAPPVARELEALHDIERVEEPLRAELTRLREQLAALRAYR